MAGGYKEELEAEMKLADPNSHASRLVAQGWFLFLYLNLKKNSLICTFHISEPTS